MSRPQISIAPVHATEPGMPVQAGVFVAGIMISTVKGVVAYEGGDVLLVLPAETVRIDPCCRADASPRPLVAPVVEIVPAGPLATDGNA